MRSALHYLFWGTMLTMVARAAFKDIPSHDWFASTLDIALFVNASLIFWRGPDV